jgi:CRP/FNR family transcriptional regulator, cyclic AMP receptor protein
MRIGEELGGGASAQVTREVVRIFEADAGLRRALDTASEHRFRRHVVTDVMRFAPGRWSSLDGLSPDVFALLVLDGVLCRRIVVARRGSVELLGRSDVVRPWEEAVAPCSLPSHVSWRAIVPTRVALLDAEFLSVVARQGGALTELMSRMAQRCDSLARRLAMLRERRLDARLLMLFWHIADRWGKVESEGIRIPLRLNHETLAELVCAQRPPVTVALQHLCRSGRLERSADGSWRLFGAPPAEQTMMPPLPADAPHERRKRAPALEPAIS